jgi:1-aminocyclopropane-1-carboxylate deaminase
MNDFKLKYDISLDPIYTSKLAYGVLNLITNNFFKPNSKILMIHTGGHQGILAMNKYLKDKNLTTINYK